MSEIILTTDELSAVCRRVVPFRSTDPARPALASITAHPGPDGLRWLSADSFRLVSLRAGRSDLRAPVALPIAILEVAEQHSRAWEKNEAYLWIDERLDSIVYHHDRLRVVRDLPAAKAPNLSAVLETVPSTPPIEVVVDGAELAWALAAVLVHSDSAFPTFNPVVHIRCDGIETIQLTSTWPDQPPTSAFLNVRCDREFGDQSISVDVNGAALYELVSAAGPRDQHLAIGAPKDPLRLWSSDGFRAVLMTIADRSKDHAPELEIEIETDDCSDDALVETGTSGLAGGDL